MSRTTIMLEPIGRVRSPLTDRRNAPMQGTGDTPDAWLIFRPEFAEGLKDLAVGEDILVLTWLHEADRNVLRVHRSGDRTTLRGVFSSRSPDRPNPIGLHRVNIVERRGDLELRVRNLEAIDATPILDIKPTRDPRER